MQVCMSAQWRNNTYCTLTVPQTNKVCTLVSYSYQLGLAIIKRIASASICLKENLTLHWCVFMSHFINYKVFGATSTLFFFLSHFINYKVRYWEYVVNTSFLHLLVPYLLGLHWCVFTSYWTNYASFLHLLVPYLLRFSAIKKNRTCLCPMLSCYIKIVEPDQMLQYVQHCPGQHFYSLSTVEYWIAVIHVWP